MYWTYIMYLPSQFPILYMLLPNIPISGSYTKALVGNIKGTGRSGKDFSNGKSLLNKNQTCSMPYACSSRKYRISNMSRKIINNVNGNMNIHIHTYIHINCYPPPTWLCCSKMMLERHTWRAEKWWRPVLTLIILVMCRPAHSARMIVDGFLTCHLPRPRTK